MQKVHLSHRLTDSDEWVTGMPVSADTFGQRTMQKLISGVGVDGDNQDLVFYLADNSLVRIFPSHRGVEVVFIGPQK